LHTIPFVTPAILRLSFRNTDLVTYFVPVWSVSLNVGFWTFHFSGMGRFIRQQMDTVAAGSAGGIQSSQGSAAPPPGEEP
jgi:hypothetical protein